MTYVKIFTLMKYQWIVHGVPETKAIIAFCWRIPINTDSRIHTYIWMRVLVVFSMTSVGSIGNMKNSIQFSDIILRVGWYADHFREGYNRKIQSTAKRLTGDLADLYKIDPTFPHLLATITWFETRHGEIFLDRCKAQDLPRQALWHAFGVSLIFLSKKITIRSFFAK